MAGEHINMLMVEAPARRTFAVDRSEPDGWVTVAEYESLESAQDARDRMVADGVLDAEEVRVRGERGTRWGRWIWFGILAALALVNAVLYITMLAVD